MALFWTLATAAFGLVACVANTPSGVSESSSKRILAVIETLSDVLESIQNEENEEQTSYGDFMSWCQTETNTTSEALEKARLQYVESKASAKELEATVEQLEQVLSDSTGELEEAQDTIGKANIVRESDQEKHEKDMQINQQSMNQITEAIKIVDKVHKGAPSFMQVSARRASASVDAEQARLTAPGESSYVLGIMKGLYDRISQTRTSMEAAEQESVQRHESLLIVEKSRASTLKGTISVKRQEDAQARVQLVQVQHQCERLEKEIRELGSLLAEVSTQCEDKKKWWSVRVGDRSLEKAALGQAIEYLRQANISVTPPPSFVQVRFRRHDSGHYKALSPDFLQAGSAAQHKSVKRALLGAASAQVLALASGSKGRQGTLDAAKAVVKKLIGVLQKEQDDEFSMKKYCEDALDRKTNEQATVTAEIERLNASIARKVAEVDVLSAEVAAIEKALDQLKASLEEAAQIRKKEHAIYEAGAKDRNLAVKVLMQAKEALKTFYATADKTALAQASVKLASRDLPPTMSKGSSRKDLASAAIVQIIEKVAGEIGKEETDAKIEEQAAASAFEQLHEDSREEFDTQMQAITERVKVRAQTSVHVGTDKETRTQKTEDKVAVVAQLENLHNECDELLANFDGRLKARSFEMNQLEDVIDILSGSQVAVRTGFVQDDSGDTDRDESAAMDARERELLQDLAQAAGSIAAAHVGNS